MWQMLCGFSLGIYIGTYYNCKPMIEQVVLMVKDVQKKLPAAKKE